LLDTFTAVYLWIGSQANAQETTKSFEFAQRYIVEATDGRDVDCPVIAVKSAEEPMLFTSFFVGWDTGMAERNKYVDPYQAKLDKLAKDKADQEAKDGSTTTAAPAVTLHKTTPKPDSAPATTTSSTLSTPALKHVGATATSDAAAKPAATTTAAAKPAAAATTTAAKPTTAATTTTAPVAAAKPVTTAAAPAAKASSTGTYSWDDVVGGQIPGMDLTMKENYLDAATFQAKFGCTKAQFDAQPKWKRDAKKKELGIF